VVKLFDAPRPEVTALFVKSLADFCSIPGLDRVATIDRKGLILHAAVVCQQFESSTVSPPMTAAPLAASSVTCRRTNSSNGIRK